MVIGDREWVAVLWNRSASTPVTSRQARDSVVVFGNLFLQKLGTSIMAKESLALGLKIFKGAWHTREGCQKKKNLKKYGLLPNPPRTPPHMSIKGESWESRIPGTQGYWQALFFC